MLEKTEGANKMDTPEKLATKGIQDKEKHNTICVGHHYRQYRRCNKKLTIQRNWHNRLHKTKIN